MSRAVVLGGTGLIGRAAVRRLLAAGWDVAAVGRDRVRMPEDVVAAEGRFVAADSDDPRHDAAGAHAVGSGEGGGWCLGVAWAFTFLWCESPFSLLGSESRSTSARGRMNRRVRPWPMSAPFEPV
ncbi:MAG TPA: NAD-dependent epimerase/dehydratase family protein [Pseudonocardiaceae bacterium]|nr:NAD-dependent epimerase/dehydratase family protein [Pseudonocardiaceae bacterium]